MLSQDGMVSCRGVSCCVGGNPALLLRTPECTLAVGVPAVVELAFIFVGPLLRDVVRAVDRAARPVHEERLVGLERPVPAQPADRVVRQVFAEVIALRARFLAAGRYVVLRTRFGSYCEASPARKP